METWSPTLRMMTGLLLANRFPMLLWWGPEYVSIYNDSYRPVLGTKHPWGLGQPVRECWQEIWHVLQPLIDTPYRGGPATWNEDILLEINRHGFLEETHFTIAYSPVPDESVPSGIGGVLATVNEITGKVVAERRVTVLRDLGAFAVEAKNAGEACRITAGTLAAHDKDVPFAMLYLLDKDGGRARLAGSADCTVGEPGCPETVALDAGEDRPWPFEAALRDRKMQVVGNLEEIFGEAVPPGPWSDRPREAVVMAIPSNLAQQPLAILVAGVSARLKFDESYRGFFELIVGQIASAVANASAYEEEKRRAEALAEIDRAKTQFLSNVSHEFRTPITLMLGPIEDMLEDRSAVLPPFVRGQIEVVHRSSLRLLKLVNTILDFSRIEAGRMQANYEETDLPALTAELASNFRSACEREKLAFQVDCPPFGAGVSPACVDRDMWEKIVLNLLSNAFKFTLAGGIEVSLRAEAGLASLVVRDTGCGIATEDQPRIFERFYRAKDSRGRTLEGTGIGLALVQELVKLHGGTVHVSSKAGGGSTFTVRIPLGKAHLDPSRIGGSDDLSTKKNGARIYLEEALRWLPNADKDAGKNGAPHAPRHTAMRKASILWADDNADMRDYVARLLSEHYVVEPVADGLAALEKARQMRESGNPPDLVLSDVMMPRLDGFGLLRAMRSDPALRSIPIILLSARAGEEARIEGIGAGADDYLIKPFSARELRARVDAQIKMASIRDEAGRAVRESENRFRAFTSATSDVVYQMSPDWAEMRHLQGREFITDTLEPSVSWLAKYIHPDDQQRVTDAIRQAISTKGTFELEHRVIRVDGTLGWTYSKAIPILDERGEILEWFGTASDVTARKVAEERLQQLAADLAEADRRKDGFLAILAHELRGPLAPLANMLQIMKSADGDRELMWKARETMERQLWQMVRIVDDLLDVSRITRNKLELRKERVELASIIYQAVEACRSLAEGARHEVTVTLPDEPIHLVADPARLVQVFSNLLNNACKYTEPGGHISLTAQRREKDVIVKVRDTGLGISPDKRASIFDMFTQVNQSLDRAQGGLGIGLTLVKQLVEMHGGSVEATSDGLGLGSEFIVRLPALFGAPAASPAGPRSAASHALSGRRILVVDDNLDSAATLAMLLGFSGHELATAHDGLEAVEKAEHFLPEIVLLDIGLPKLNGLDAGRRIREQPWGKKMVLIALTGWGQEEDRRRSQDAGFDAHLVKPVDFTVLNSLLDSLVGEHGKNGVNVAVGDKAGQG
jgi:signal transduction histidine kinase